VVARLGGPLEARPLHFVWLLDCSGSMRLDGRIQALNTAVVETLPLMREVADANPHAALLVRAVAFSTGARWHIADPTPVHDVVWRDLQPGGDTDLGAALSLVAGALAVPPMEERALPPVLVLVSDGGPTDDYRAGLRALAATPWGPKAVRVAIAVGRSADYEVLQEFLGPDAGRRPIPAGSPEELIDSIRWTSTIVVRDAPLDVAGTVRNPPAKPPPPSDMLVWGEPNPGG
jgi:uncharacterized protein YegL